MDTSANCKMKYSILLFFSILSISNITANNILVENVTLVNQNTAEDHVWIKFDLSWENSWRTSNGPQNWDAAWVFAKYRVNSGAWKHVRMHYVDGIADGHSGPVGVTINTASDEVGCFIHRSTEGSGDNDWDNIHLRWDYGDNGVGDNDIIDIQVFAYEMVYVNEGAFSLGGGNGTEVGKFYKSGFIIFGFPVPSYNVTSSGAITVGSNFGNLNYSTSTSGSRPGDQLGPIPAAFPNGFDAFYSMKYELTQGQWVDMFNTLNGTQKTTLDITGPNGKGQDEVLNRNAISWPDGTASATTSLPNIPLNYVNNNSRLAFFDWGGLRPITELEYEKACRGPVPVVADGFAWGNANIHGSPYTYTNLGTSAVNVSNMGELTGNAAYSTTNGTPTGPKRVGIFASSAINPSREETGASYYGIMELTGNLYEVVVSVGHPRGRLFDGQHGDGILNSNGDSNDPNWPNPNEGFGYRGGSYINGADFIRVSDRYDAASVLIGANNRLGARGGRTTQN